MAKKKAPDNKPVSDTGEVFAAKEDDNEVVECVLLRKNWYWLGKKTGQRVVAPRRYAENLENLGWLKILGETDDD